MSYNREALRSIIEQLEAIEKVLEEKEPDNPPEQVLTVYAPCDKVWLPIATLPTEAILNILFDCPRCDSCHNSMLRLRSLKVL